ncbi:MAG: glycosyltransferase family 39 protein, partial [Gammaproteobacteria bacterium]
MSTPLRRRWPLLALLLLLAFAFQGLRGLWDPDEGRYTAVALEMLDSGDWLHPRLHPELPHYTKPPLTYWALAASLGLFGRHEWAARLPNAIAFFCTALLVAGLARRLGMPAPEPAALVYATTVLPFAAANAVTTDTLLTLWETLAMWAFVAGWRTDLRHWPALCWLALGLAFLTKGPPGLLPLLALLLWLLHRRDYSRLGRLFSPVGLAVFAVTGLGWYLLVVQDTPGLLGYFLHKEVAGRILTAGHHRHGEWYGGLEVYVPTLVIGALPWWPLAWWYRRRHPASRETPEAIGPFLGYWFFVPLVVFMLARSRLPLYLLPLFVPLVLLLYRALAPGFVGGTGPGLRLALACALLLPLLRAAGAWLPAVADGRRFAARLAVWTNPDLHEVLFVDTKPRYSLRFYLDLPVEQVYWRHAPDAMRFRPPESLDRELRRDRYPRLLLAQPGDTPALE